MGIAKEKICDILILRLSNYMSNKLNQDIIEAIFNVFKSVKHNISKDYEKLPVTPVQFEALHCVRKNKEITMSQISEYFKTTLPTTTALIDKLISAKLAVRKNDPKDRRVIKIAITSQGEKVLDEAEKHRTIVMNKMLSYLSENDKKELLRIFDKILEKTNNEK